MIQNRFNNNIVKIGDYYIEIIFSITVVGASVNGGYSGLMYICIKLLVLPGKGLSKVFMFPAVEGCSCTLRYK